MKTAVRETSLKSYDAIRADGTAATQAGRVLAYVRRNPGASRGDIERSTGIRINAVCGRVNELLEANALRETAEKIDPETRQPVMMLEAVPVQARLDLEAA